MIDVDSIFKSIRNIYQIVSGKGDTDVYLTYKGKDYGVSKPYQAKIDIREFNHETYDGALVGLLDMLKKELTDKAKLAENEANRLKQALTKLDN